LPERSKEFKHNRLDTIKVILIKGKTENPIFRTIVPFVFMKTQSRKGHKQN
jgi:hypothetical protein